MHREKNDLLGRWARSSMAALALCVTCIYSIGPAWGQNNPTKPNISYQSSTPEECLLEKDCAWDAFAKMVGVLDWKGRPRKDGHIHKWEGNLGYSTANMKSKYQAVISGSLEQLSPFFPHEYKEDESSKHLIVFSKDLEKSMEEYQSRFLGKQVHPNDMFLEIGPYPCFSGTIDNDRTGQPERVTTVININHQFFPYCIAISMYNSLGLVGKSFTKKPVHQFSLFTEKKSDDLLYTDLDKFILYLLYQPEFKNGQDLKQVQSVFDKIYKNSKDKFLVLLEESRS